MGGVPYDSSRGRFLRGSVEEVCELPLAQGVPEQRPDLDPSFKGKGPLLFVVGSADTVTVHESCKMLYEVSRQPKSWVEISGADHGYSEHR